eukprot:TRINITY_DN1794_c0_g1_i1.p1 TRINITY_DN1794_c0_g1~~TRINITY_DN1794_c0_g1_i1.p1  ORF type:complete len:824 (-),score=108.38 TRINITY_DN1794_c0_g1_i1:5-2476(-)
MRSCNMQNGMIFLLAHQTDYNLPFAKQCGMLIEKKRVKNIFYLNAWLIVENDIMSSSTCPNDALNAQNEPDFEDSEMTTKQYAFSIFPISAVGSSGDDKDSKSSTINNANGSVSTGVFQAYDFKRNDIQTPENPISPPMSPYMYNSPEIMSPISPSYTIDSSIGAESAFYSIEPSQSSQQMSSPIMTTLGSPIVTNNQNMCISFSDVNLLTSNLMTILEHYYEIYSLRYNNFELFNDNLQKHFKSYLNFLVSKSYSINTKRPKSMYSQFLSGIMAFTNNNYSKSLEYFLDVQNMFEKIKTELDTSKRIVNLLCYKFLDDKSKFQLDVARFIVTSYLQNNIHMAKVQRNEQVNIDCEERVTGKKSKAKLKAKTKSKTDKAKVSKMAKSKLVQTKTKLPKTIDFSMNMLSKSDNINDVNLYCIFMIHSGSVVEALQYAVEYIGQNSDNNNSILYNTVGICLFILGRLSEAQSIFQERVYQFQVFDDSILNHVTTTFYLHGINDEIIQLSSLINSIKQDLTFISPFSLFVILNICLKLGYENFIESSLNILSTIFPENGNIQMLNGIFLLFSGTNHDRAKACFKKSLSLHPFLNEGHLGLATVHFQRLFRESKISKYNRQLIEQTITNELTLAIELNASNEIGLLKLGNLAMEQRNYWLAEKSYYSSGNIDSNLSPALFNLLVVLQARKKLNLCYNMYSDSNVSDNSCFVFINNFALYLCNVFKEKRELVNSLLRLQNHLEMSDNTPFYSNLCVVNLFLFSLTKQTTWLTQAKKWLNKAKTMASESSHFFDLVNANEGFLANCQDVMHTLVQESQDDPILFDQSFY